MTDSLTIRPAGPVRGEIRPPGSKSITNRALVCAALADGQSSIIGALRSEDTQVMIDALRELGIEIVATWGASAIKVTGCAGAIPARRANLWVANSGTTIRFLTAVTSLGEGVYRLDGVPRMRQRPMGDLASALIQLGVDVSTESPGGCPPVRVIASGLRGGSVAVRGDVSSQFLSGMLLAAPYARAPVSIRLQGPLVSRPYVEMTRQVMGSFGIELRQLAADQYVVPVGTYLGTYYVVEPDASAACYFWAAAAIAGGSVTVSGLSRNSLQGDVRFAQLLEEMGCAVDYGDRWIRVTGPARHGITAEMSDISDTVQTLCAVATVVDGPTTVRGVSHIRHKETDRIGNLAIQLRKLGASVEVRDDGLTVTPGPLRAATIETYDDHRMAMSFAVIGLKQPGIRIVDPACVAKTYPDFFRDLESLNTGG